MVGTGVGAEMGILIKGGAALEQGWKENESEWEKQNKTKKNKDKNKKKKKKKAHKISHLIFDKTGTITKGKSTVSNLISLSTRYTSQILFKKTVWNLIYAAERNSEHPIAKAVCSFFEVPRIRI